MKKCLAFGIPIDRCCSYQMVICVLHRPEPVPGPIPKADPTEEPSPPLPNPPIPPEPPVVIEPGDPAIDLWRTLI